MGIKLVIFDLDGTLVNAYRAISESVNFTLNKMGYKSVSALRIRRAVGWGDKQLLAAFMPNEKLKTILSIYRGHHKLSLRRYARLLPEAAAALRFISGNNIKIAIASNRPTAFTNIILKRLDIRKYFDYVLCADKLLKGKPDPQILFRIMRRLKACPKETLYVGDMVIDVETAHKAGIKAIAVKGGSSPLSEIKKARPFKIIKGLGFFKKHL